MAMRYMPALLLTCLAASGTAGAARTAAPARPDPDTSISWRAAAAQALENRGDPGSLATAAALVFAGPPRNKIEPQRGVTALELAARASELAPNDPSIAWLYLHLCANTPTCDVRAAATTLRWIDADNAAAWLPTLVDAQKDKDATQVDRVLSEMAEGARFDLYANRATVRMFDALKRVRTQLPATYLQSDLSRLTEAIGLTAASNMPSFSALINACRDAAAAERRENCLRLSKTMQKADTVLAQLVGFAVARRLTAADTRDMRLITERRRLLEWRASSANISDTPLLPWLRNARARSRLAKMRAMPREEDVYIALLKEHGLPLEPPEERR